MFDIFNSYGAGARHFQYSYVWNLLCIEKRTGWDVRRRVAICEMKDIASAPRRVSSRQNIHNGRMKFCQVGDPSIHAPLPGYNSKNNLVSYRPRLSQLHFGNLYSIIPFQPGMRSRPDLARLQRFELNDYSRGTPRRAVPTTSVST